MSKYLLYLSLLAINFTGCSINTNSKISTSTQAEMMPVKHQKHRHKKTADGVVSVDIVNANNRLHLLTGKLKQD